MSTPERYRGLPAQGQGGQNLADILERVLAKGIVIAGDTTINVLDIELLNIKLRLLIASVDKAREMGIRWSQRHPPWPGGGSRRGARGRGWARPGPAAGLERERE